MEQTLADITFSSPKEELVEVILSVQYDERGEIQLSSGNLLRGLECDEDIFKVILEDMCGTSSCSGIICGECLFHRNNVDAATQEERARTVTALLPYLKFT